MASTYLSKTFGTATDRKKLDFVLWFKRSQLSSYTNVICWYHGSTDEFSIFIWYDNFIIVYEASASGQLVSSNK
jgi:hypothetical protein